MRAYELPAKIAPDGRLELPEAVTRLLPAGRIARVIILVPDPDDSEEQAIWYRATAEHFAAGYADADAVYDKP